MIRLQIDMQYFQHNVLSDIIIAHYLCTVVVTILLSFYHRSSSQIIVFVYNEMCYVAFTIICFMYNCRSDTSDFSKRALSLY